VRNNDRIMKIAPSTLASPSKESNDQTEDCNNNSPSVDRLSHVSPDGIQHDGVQPTIGRPFRWPTPRRNSLQHLSSDQRHLTPRQEPRRAEFCRHQPNAVDERTIAIKVFSPDSTPNHAHLHSEHRRNRLGHCLYSKSSSEVGRAGRCA
jgi:hypothetical protein